MSTDSSSTGPRRLRHSQVKAGFNAEDARRKREDSGIALRKEKRDDTLTKKRNIRSTDIDGTKPVDTNLAQRLESLPSMVAGVNSNDPKTQLEAVTQFRKLLSIEHKPPIEEVINSGVVPRFVQFLQAHDNPALQFESAWALTNIASGSSDQTAIVIDKGAVPLFVQLLASPNDDVREQAVWALGNIAGDSHQCRDYVLSYGAMRPLLGLLNDSCKLSMMRNATWTLSNFCRGKPQPAFELVSPALPTLARLIYSHDEEVLTDACWALSYLSDGTNDKIQAVIEAGVCRRMVELLMHSSPSVQTPALRTVGNIVTGDDMQTQIVINCSALPCLLSLLGSPKKSIRKEACWTISNITAGNKTQIQTIVDANIIPHLIQLLTHAEYEIKKEAAWALSNATSGGAPEQIRYLVAQGCIKPLCDLLVVSDVRIVNVALEALENILKVGEADAKESGTNQYTQFIDQADGLEKIESLQNHPNNEIYKKAVDILETYFAAEDDEVQQVAPQTGQSTYTFGTQMPNNGFKF